MGLFRKKKNDIDNNPHFNYMMYGGGYEDIQKRKESIELFIIELSKKVNECSYCGGHNIGVKEDGNRDGCHSWAYCKDCGHRSSNVMMVGIKDSDSLKKIFRVWHNENAGFPKIIDAPKIINVIKELKEISNHIDSLEDFDPYDIVKRVRMLEKWSGISK